MPTGALGDLTVVEFADSVAGPYAGRLFADLGARVIKVEPQDGDPLRANGAGTLFAWLNAGKHSVVAEAGDPRLDPLLASAGVVLHSARGGEADGIEAQCARVASGATVVGLSPYGRSGPRAGWKATPLTEYATGGFHYFGGKPGREPLALPGHHAEFHAGMQAAIAALAGWWHSRRTGRGQRVEISHQEAMLSAHSWLTTMWTHQGEVIRRTGSVYATCSDGGIYLFHLLPYENLYILMERFDLLENPEFLDPLTYQVHYPQVVAALGEWAAEKTRAEVYHAAQELRIAVSPVNTMADLLASEQLAARGFFEELDVDDRTIPAPGFPYKLAGTPCERARTAPAPGEHNALLEREPVASAPRTGGGANGPALPLEGIRVLELTANWAGPIAGRHLADLGADVIKIELAGKPATRAIAHAGADRTWPHHFDRAGYFNKLNRNKRDVCLDLSTDRGREAFLAMVRVSDVVLENNSARVMPALGLGYEQLREANPRIIMCSMSGYGASGPERNYSAFGSNIETSSGLASLLAYEEGDYNSTGSFYADPVTGGHGAIAILAALHAREHAGEGQWIDMALFEAVLPFFAPQLLDYARTGENPVPMANRHPEWSPQDVYPTAGEDCWLALSVRDGDEWHALATTIGRPDLAGDPALAGHPARRAAAPAIDEAIRAWCATFDHNEAALRLQQAGVPAAPVMANWEVASDNHLHERGFFVPISHPEAGTHNWPGFPWRFEATPLSVRYPAPRFAEHNDEVFATIAGLDDAAIAALYESGATAREPAYAQALSV